MIFSLRFFFYTLFNEVNFERKVLTMFFREIREIKNVEIIDEKKKKEEEEIDRMLKEAQSILDNAWNSAMANDEIEAMDRYATSTIDKAWNNFV